MRTITALRAEPRGRVTVELDGERWRLLPAEVVVSVGLAVGRELDRPVVRELRRALRRSEAIAAGARTLRHRDVSVRKLTERLERAEVAPAARAEALDALGRAGLVDDSRFADRRAESLAARGFGDAAIRLDLEQQGVESELREAALGALPEELARAREVVGRRGRGPKTARYLAGKGFSEDAVEAALGTSVAADT